jgi:hypothetical protein
MCNSIRRREFGMERFRLLCLMNPWVMRMMISFSQGSIFHQSEGSKGKFQSSYYYYYYYYYYYIVSNCIILYFEIVFIFRLFR